MKYSRQRDLVLKALENNVVHPTADYIYSLLRQSEPNISLATVYRNLNLLADNGVIKRISGLDGITRFDHNTSNHYHFICSNCNKIYDVPADIVGDPAKEVLVRTGLIVESFDISFRGVCQNCKKVN